MASSGYIQAHDPSSPNGTTEIPGLAHADSSVNAANGTNRILFALFMPDSPHDYL